MGEGHEGRREIEGGHTECLIEFPYDDLSCTHTGLSSDNRFNGVPHALQYNFRHQLRAL
ncbi:hypothetical protein LissoIVSPER_00054 [Lissonota sp. PSUC_FEM 10030012]|nr:hypothetical protein [Lissonota sp. PSUC_FEM 10030012]